MDAGTVTFLLVFLIGIALLFDLLNGMHDAANSIATIVSTRVLSPFIAVLWAAFFNFSAYFIGHHFGFEAKVASTIGTGLIDPDRIAIMGGAFGGYLAMCGAAFEPDTYRCAITMAGVFDWAQMIREVKNLDDNSLRSQRFLRKLGDPARNQEYFESISPIKHLDAVKVPVFVWHGRIDNVVDVEQSKRLVAQLRDHGIPCTAVFERNEGHGAAEIENRIELYTQIEQFLAANLAPRTQTLAGEPAPRSKN